MRISHCDSADLRLLKNLALSGPYPHETESVSSDCVILLTRETSGHSKLSRRMFSRKTRSLGLKLVPYFSRKLPAYQGFFKKRKKKKLCRSTFRSLSVVPRRVGLGLAFRGKLRESTLLINCQDIRN